MFKDMHYLPDPQGVCPAGLHWATIKSVTPLGNIVTRYGPKTDVVRFDLRLNVDGKEYKIAPDFPLSVHVESNFRKLLIAVFFVNLSRRLRQPYALTLSTLWGQIVYWYKNVVRC